jgi:ABC-type polysaccharide/polyol phosphate export permease
LEIDKPSALETTWRRLRELCARHETIVYLTVSNLRAGHRDKLLGHLWNLLDPLMFMLVYYFVFGVLFNLGGQGRSGVFMLYILVGVLVFRFFESSLSQAATCIRSNRGLIHEINFPKGIFPVSVVLSRLYDLGWGLLVLFGGLLLAGVWPSVQLIWLLLVLLAGFTLGLSLAVAYLGAFFADTSNVITIALRLLFYLCPIFYFVRSHGEFTAAFDDPQMYALYMLNPLSAMLELLRDSMLWGVTPDFALLGYSVAVTAVALAGGFVIFAQGEGKFAKYV